MNTSAETAVKPSKGSRAFTVIKGLTKIGAVCAVLLLMVNINDQLRSINSTANHTALKLNGLSKTLDEFFAPVKEKTSAEKTDAAKVVSAGGMVLCEHGVEVSRLFSHLPGQRPDVLVCVFSDISLKPSSYCGMGHDVHKGSAVAHICLNELLNRGWKITHHSISEHYNNSWNRSFGKSVFIFEK